MYIDTHTHLYEEQLNADETDMIQRAIDAGVGKMYMPNCDSSTIAAMMRIAAAWPANCYPMMGLHPCYVKDNYKDELAIAEAWLAKEKFYALGEIGLDYYWDKTHVAQQKQAFATQIDWALQHKLPIVIHSRESTQDCIDIVRGKQNGQLCGVFHCFSGTIDEAKQIIDLGFYLGIGGVVTFKKSTLPDIIKETGLQHIVLETDAPYLAPMPYRGKRNESAYLPLIAEKIGDVMQMSREEVARITTANAEKLFGC
ncbi:hydrolase TatD [Chitinophagaceae bacterium IBVUCB1]|nr:hydrolase TatD [Chitinophagaceae bacterium IBVUCB1]